MRTNTSKKRGLVEKIFSLKQTKEGFNRPYRTIIALLQESGYGNVSLGTISYHLGKGQKEKTIETNRKRQEGICSKVRGFIYDKRQPYREPAYKIGPIRKKARGFTYGAKALRKKATYKVNKNALKHPNRKVWDYIGKVFPGIKSEKDKVQAVNQWTGELDYEDGKPLLFPYMRCKLSGDIYNAKGSDVHADHIDGDRLNNSIENFSFVSGRSNVMKGRMSYKEWYKEICKIATNLERYKELWNGQE